MFRTNLKPQRFVESPPNDRCISSTGECAPYLHPAETTSFRLSGWFRRHNDFICQVGILTFFCSGISIGIRAQRQICIRQRLLFSSYDSSPVSLRGSAVSDVVLSVIPARRSRRLAMCEASCRPCSLLLFCFGRRFAMGFGNAPRMPVVDRLSRRGKNGHWTVRVRVRVAVSVHSKFRAAPASQNRALLCYRSPHSDALCA